MGAFGRSESDCHANVGPRGRLGSKAKSYVSDADDPRESVGDPTRKVLLCFSLPGTVVGGLSLLKAARPALGSFSSARSSGIRFGGIRRERQARPMDDRARPGYSGSCVEYRVCIPA